MGFYQQRLEEVEKLKKEYERLGHEAFIASFAKVDAFTGPADSIHFLNDLFKKEKEKRECTTSQK